MTGARDLWNIAVCGVSACTPLGGSAESSAAAVRAGISAYADHPFMINLQGEPMVVAMSPHLDRDAPLAERLATLLRICCTQAVDKIDRSLETDRSLHVFVALPEFRPGFESRDVETIRRLFGAGSWPRFDLLPEGHAGGLMALARAADAIEKGATDVCLVAGCDSYMSPETLEWLDKNGQLHSSATASGFVPGEAAGSCLLASPEGVRRLSLTPFGFLRRVSQEVEANRIKDGSVCLGRGLTNAVRDTLAVLPATEMVSQTICDLNGEGYRADEFGFTIARTSERFVDATDVLSPADCWGDVGAASGPLFVSLWAASVARQYASGRWTLLWASSENGARAAALLDANREERWA